MRNVQPVGPTSSEVTVLEASSPLRSLSSCKERDGEWGSSRCGDLASEGVRSTSCRPTITLFAANPMFQYWWRSWATAYTGRKRIDNQGVDFIPLFQSDDVTGFARWVERFRQMFGARGQISATDARSDAERVRGDLSPVTFACLRGEGRCTPPVFGTMGRSSSPITAQ